MLIILALHSKAGRSDDRDLQKEWLGSVSCYRKVCHDWIAEGSWGGMREESRIPKERVHRPSDKGKSGQARGPEAVEETSIRLEYWMWRMSKGTDDF